MRGIHNNPPLDLKSHPEIKDPYYPIPPISDNNSHYPPHMSKHKTRDVKHGRTISSKSKIPK